MRWRKRNKPSVPVRCPHPDAGIEAELQRILALRRAVGRQEQLIEQNLKQIQALRYSAGKVYYRDEGREFGALAEGLVAENAGLETVISGLYDRIDERIAKLTVSDLAYL